MRYARPIGQLRSKVTPSFAVKLALLGGLSVPFASGVAMFIDPINNPVVREVYGTTTERYLGPGIFLVGIASSLMIYVVNHGESDPLRARRKGLLTFLSSVVVGFVLLANFYPFPHTGVLLPMLAYSSLMGFMSLVYHNGIRSTELKVAGASITAKVEGVKLEFELWFRTLILLVTTVVVGGGVVLFRIFEESLVFFQGNLRAAYLLTIGLEIQTLFLIVLVISVAWLMFDKLGQISDVMKELKKDSRDE